MAVARDRGAMEGRPPGVAPPRSMRHWIADIQSSELLEDDEKVIGISGDIRVLQNCYLKQVRKYGKRT